MTSSNRSYSDDVRAHVTDGGPTVTIDPSFLDGLGRFRAALNRETTELRQGDQQSPRVGEGLTFSD